MVTKTILLACVIFTILGLTAIIVGVTLIVQAGKEVERSEQPTTLQITILPLAGRVISITGAVLLAATLSICLYLCILGSSSGRSASVPDYTACGSQLSKAIHIRQTKSLASAASAAGHKWSVNEALATPGKTQRHGSLIPGGDVCHTTRGSVDTKTDGLKTKNYQSNIPDTSSNCVFNYPRYPELSPRKSLVTGFPLIKTSTTRATTGISQNTNERRLWMPPSLNGEPRISQTTMPVELGGYQLEPLSNVLHAGGRIRTGGSNV